jgi:GTPase
MSEDLKRIALVGPKDVSSALMELMLKAKPGVYSLVLKSHSEDVSSFFGVILVISTRDPENHHIVKNVQGKYFKGVPVVACFVDHELTYSNAIQINNAISSINPIFKIGRMGNECIPDLLREVSFSLKKDRTYSFKDSFRMKSKIHPGGQR